MEETHMGRTTHQYSENELISIYQEYMDSYERAVLKLEEFMHSSYAKKININLFLDLHYSFCKDAISVFKDAIKKIENNCVDKNICIRLEKLFQGWREEHVSLEDTYSRVDYENTKEYCEYLEIHVKLRTLCDEMGYLDETLPFVESLINQPIGSQEYINIIEGDLNNSQIQQGTWCSSQNKE